MQMNDCDGDEIHEGDFLASTRNAEGLRFVYEISCYMNSFHKPYIYRQVDDGSLEVVGRANQDLDLSQFKLIPADYATAQKLDTVPRRPEVPH